MTSAGVGPGGGAGLTRRVLLAWGDMRGSLRWLLSRRPSEATLLVFLLVAGLFRFGESLARLQFGPGTAERAPDTLTATLLAGIVFFALIWPIALYLLALAGHAIARAAGGTGSGHASRAAMAWAALVSGPVALVATTAGLIAAPLAGPAVGNVIGAVGFAAFAYAIAHCFAEAHGFRRPWAVFAAIAGLILVLALAARMLGG